MFWNKKVTLERYKAYVSHVDGRLNEIFRDSDPRLKNLESKQNLILDHLKLKYVPETETKEPAKLVAKAKKKGRPKKKPELTGDKNKTERMGWVIRPKKK